MEKILDKILEDEPSFCHINQLDKPRYKLFEPLFPESSTTTRTRKIILEEFLKDYHKASNVIKIDNENEFTPGSQSVEVKFALRNLEFKIDPFFETKLKLHQIEGLQFMWNRVYEKKRGCLLAHSMGLGKSLQVITLLTTMYQQLKENPESNFPTGKRVLILAPLVTLSNWTDEFEKWAVDGVENVIGEVFNITDIGTNRASRLTYIKYWYTNGGIMLINYDQFRSVLTTGSINDKEIFYHYLVNPGPDMIILDEAHRIKNTSSVLSAYVNKIRTRSRVCLTAYPLQNRLLEYYYMIDFIAPGLLGSKEEFDAYFGNYIDKCYSDSSKTIKQQATFKLYVLQLLTAHVTHRRDEEILTKDLPPKTDYVVRFKLSPIQRKGYMLLLKLACFDNPMVSLLILRSICNHPKIFQTFLSRRFAAQRNKELRKKIAEGLTEDELMEEDEWTEEDELVEEELMVEEKEDSVIMNDIEVIEILDSEDEDENKNDQIIGCDTEEKNNDQFHPIEEEEEEEEYELIDTEDELEEEPKNFEIIDETLDNDVVEDNEEAAFSKIFTADYDWTREYLDNTDIESWKCSGKISFIADLAKDCKLANEKLVVVSHSLACLDYLQHLLPIFGVKTSKLDGSLVSLERKRIIDEFETNKNINVMLLSAKASAIGINLVSSNRIVLIDQDWNPLYDEQSVGRIYRYGQTKPVIVYRLVMASTIEERIYKQSVHKKSISTRVIDNKQSAVISKEELKRYFQEPDENLGLIDIENELAVLNLDSITKNVLKENANTITQFMEYQYDNLHSHKKTVETTMTPDLRLRAKHDAVSIINKWRTETSFNL